MTAPKVKTTWRSDRLQREVTLVRWGTFGKPVLLFPTAGGDAEEIERMHLVGAVGELLEAIITEVSAPSTRLSCARVMTRSSGNGQGDNLTQTP